MWWYLGASLLLGFIIGSFLNVVLLRFHTGRGYGGNSMCFSCGKKLGWYELLPIVSAVVQRWRCRLCAAKFSKHYTWIELLTGLGFMGIVFRVQLWQHPESWLMWMTVLIGWSLVSFAVLIAFYDMKHFIMPLVWVATFGILAFATIWFPLEPFNIFGHPHHVTLLSHLLASVLLPLPFVVLWLLSKGSLIGFGDIQFMVCMGLLLGISAGITAIFLAFWIGTVCMVGWGIWQIAQHRFSLHYLRTMNMHDIMKQEIPFAPFLIAATFLVLFGRLNLLSILMS